MDPLPPDPYAALGVSKDADAATIKSRYRKLVLTCHPDKVTDESLKQQKAEEFHKIQSAWELIGEENKRATYDAEVRLHQLKKEKLGRSASGPEVRTTHYDVRTAAPAGARGPTRYDDRKQTRSYDEDSYYGDRSSSRKYDSSYDTYPKRSSAPRTSRPKEEPIKVTRVATDRTRSDQKRTKDRDDRKDRSHKFVYIDDDSESDEKARYEAEYRRRTDEARRQAQKAAEDERVRKEAADARRKAEEDRARRSFEDSIPKRHGRSDDRDESDGDYRSRKYSDLEDGVKHYIGRARASADHDARPSASRTNSSRDARPEYYDVRPSKSRPEAVRRVSRTSERPSASGRESRRERKGSSFPEIVEWDSDRSPPSFKHSASSPAEIKTVPRAPVRSYTETSHKGRETSPTPLRRSDTDPVRAYPTYSKQESRPARSSNLRTAESAVPHDSGYSSPGTPENTYPQIPSSSGKKTVYRYPAAGGGVPLTAEDINVVNGNGHRTVLREPDHHKKTRSPSPLSRPPMGANRTASSTTAPRYVQAPAPPRTTPHAVPPPPLGRSTTMHASPERLDRERGHKLYGEVDSEYTRSRGRQPTSYDFDQVNWGKKIGPEDIRWSTGSRGRDREPRVVPVDKEYARPPLRKHETYAY